MIYQNAYARIVFILINSQYSHRSFFGQMECVLNVNVRNTDSNLENESPSNLVRFWLDYLISTDDLKKEMEKRKMCFGHN